MGGRPSLVLPWCKNGCAPEYLRRNPSADRLQLVCLDIRRILDVAQGLKYLHTMKPPIVHGDLKGNNILITDEGRGTLSDFGLAQVIEEICSQPPEYTTSDLGFGPIRWQAPELVSDDTGRPKMPGDIWSFGCTNYELLTGKLPYHFRARDPQVIQDIQNGIRPPGPEENSRRCGDNGIWDLMNDCWINAAEERIQITDVVFRLEDICARTNVLL
ncbi:kinase-like protein [Dendrothele bispora CBS 962.96]|uniref:Kinase-like protein n=1 Tax=Dendrothele bispora (strain CBS 962.96) TaxID=1314807 RepID=A0A4S8M8S5_DENBC|nr:kinase-like protein [Dendrothele bispora CBS 962.96]